MYLPLDSCEYAPGAKRNWFGLRFATLPDMSEHTEELVSEMTSHISQFKEMSHRAKLRIEKLAELSLVIEGELKQKEYADRVSELFGVATQFEEKLDSLIHDYEIERNRIRNEEL